MAAVSGVGADRRGAFLTIFLAAGRARWAGLRKSGGSRQRRIATWCAALAAASICVAGAEERSNVNPAEPIAFDIPAQPLAAALQAYGQKTGVQVLYESNSAAGQTSGAVAGNFTANAALSLLLTGTDLRVQYLRPDAITLAPPSSVDADRPPATPLVSADLNLGTLRVRAANDGDDTARLNDYSASVQAD